MKQNKRYIFVILLCIIITMFTACNSSSNDTSLLNDRSTVSVEESDKSNSFSYNNIIPPVGEPIEVRFIYGFSSDRSWVEYFKQGQEDCFVGCIDKEGNMIFSFKENHISKYTPFECGVSCIIDNTGNFYLINDTGTILRSSSQSGCEGLASYGDGYFLVYKNIGRYDSDEFLYSIIDNTGKAIKEISSKECTQICWDDFEKRLSRGQAHQSVAAYCGEGIFQFMKSPEFVLSSTSSPKTKCSYVFYDINTDTFFEKTCNYMFNKAEVVDGKCILWESGEDVVFNINTKEEEAPIYVSVYADETGTYPLSPYKDSNSLPCLQIDQYADRVLVQFEGKDNNAYIAVIDSNGGVIMKPQRCKSILTASECHFSCDRFCIETENDTLICDTDGNIVFSLSDIGGEYITEFSDNVAIVDRTKVVDKNGNALFESINTAKTKLISIP